MRNRFIYIIFGIISITLTFLSSCSPEEMAVQEMTGQHVCKLVLDASVSIFEGDPNTRATSDNIEIWEHGSTVYLSFAVGANRVDGKAVYNKNEDEWTLYYNGVIHNGTVSTCNAYFFDGGVMDNLSNLSIPTDIPVYNDAYASYSKTAEGMKVNATLVPLTGRIRFKGANNKGFRLSGVNYYTSFDITKCELKSNDNTLDMNVGPDGFTSYVHAYFAPTSRKLIIAYDNLSFSTECGHPVLDAGQSGYMEIPTEEKHNGWNMIKMSLPIVAVVTVSDIGVGKASFSSQIINDGNGNIKDCGFCYSTSANPTTTDASVSYGGTTGKFGKTITGLTENTTYHVRAYATNELGTAYGEDVSFKTLEVTVPILSAVTMKTISNTSAEMEATVISLGNGTLRDAGFVYSTNQYPTLDDTKISCGKATSLKSVAQGLMPETKYYVRAYAINEKGTSYGEEKSFMTTKTVVNPYTTITVETSYGSMQFDMAKIDGGSFLMGAQKTSSSQDNYDKDAYSDESPVHTVSLSTYYIGKTEVTQKLWYVVMGSYPNISSNYGLGDDYPIYNVSYTQCLQFIKKLNSITNQKFRLPTEAEWEYAARGGKNTSESKFSGSNTIGSVAWYKNNSSDRTHPVAEKQANEMNVFDMTGNVWEWCSDWYGNYSISSQTNPIGPSSGPGRVIRGGGYNDSASECRVTVRSNASESSSFSTLGLRLVME